VLRTALLLLAAAAYAQSPTDTILGEWTFPQTGDVHGWTANNHVTEVAARGSALHGRAVGSDPMFVSPKVEIRNQPASRVEIRLRADKGGIARFFWAPSLTGRFGGFDPKRELGFTVVGDGQFHDYVLFPNWADDAMLYHLRVNLPPGASVDLASLRVVAFAAESGAAMPPRWDFMHAGSTSGWRALESDATLTAADGALSVRSPGSVTLVSPRAAIVPSQVEWIAVQMKTAVAEPVSVWWTGPKCKGIQTLVLNPVADSAFHTYNLNAGGAGCWWNAPDRIGLQFRAGSGVLLRWVRVTALPEGEAELSIENLAPTRAINRRGQSFEVACTIVNRGGRPASGAVARILVPKGVTVEQAPDKLATVVNGEPQRLFWRLKSKTALDAAISVKVEAPGALPGKATAHVAITEPPAVAPSSYVPEPKPAATPYEIGAYYYPGWWNDSRWDPIRRFPGRTPVLGFYKEGDPTVVDWQIKYAVEHGIRFLAVDWYWRDGHEDLRDLYAGLFTARYRKLLKFCFLYANHDPFNVHDRAEWRNVVRYWLDQYFHREEFYKIEGKPVIVMFSPANLRSTLGGSEGVKAALDEAREMARKAGFPGIYFMACASPDEAELRRLHDEGYDVATAYNYPSAGANQGDRSPYHDLVDAYVSIWDHLRAAGSIDYLLAPLAGWDPRPWHGENTLARPGNTPEEFRRMLLAARDRMDPKGPPSRRVMIIEAWNEWGEGSTVEPDLEDGFRKVDAIREVFAPDAGPHVDVAPTDVGMPLIEWPAEPPSPPRWSFSTAADWQGWSASAITGREIHDGRLAFRTSGADPLLVSPAFTARARSYTKAAIRMSVSANADVQLFWQTEDSAGMSELRSVHFTAHPGAMTTYEVPLAQTPHWRGVITRLRLDPGASPGTAAEVESLALEP
jgi:hypothetical protein